MLSAMFGFTGCGNAQNSAGYTNMDVNEFANFITGDGVQLVDVRTPEEYAQGHIADARNIDVFNRDFLQEAEKSLDKSKPVAVYCRSGKRSADAARILSQAGFKVVNLKGGIIAWVDAGRPL